MRPDTEAQLAEIVTDATGPLRIRGGGTRAIGTVTADAEIDTTAIEGIKLYEPGALTLVAAAGTPLATIEETLAADGQRLAFEPMDHRVLLGSEGTPTIGGVVAANVSGPRRIQTGACRDFMLGVRFVDGQGRILENGGRVMKNVTGYDLVKLLTGSWGTLGVLTEVSLKVLPRPESMACVLINGLDTDTAIDALSRALGSPFDVTGAAHTPSGLDGHPVTMIRIEGFAQSVAYRSEQVRGLFADHDVTIETDPDNVTAGWRWVRDVEAFQNKDGDVWRISVKPSDAPEVARRIGATETLFDWGGGLIWALVPTGSDLRAALGDIPGHATLVRRAGPSDIPTFQPEPMALAKLTAGLKSRFDPRGILNTGLMDG